MPTQRDLLRALGNRISKERQKRGITLEKLAYEMGLSKGNLSDIERGRRDPRFTTLRAIATGLRIPVALLIKDTER